MFANKIAVDQSEFKFAKLVQLYGERLLTLDLNKLGTITLFNYLYNDEIYILIKVRGEVVYLAKEAERYIGGK